MAKEWEKIELRPVDEEAEKVTRYVRLNADNTEEVEELPPVRVGEAQLPEEGQAYPGRIRHKTRSNEPDIGSLIERQGILHKGDWEAPASRISKLPWGWLALVGCVFAGSITWSLVAVKLSDKKQDLIVDRTEKIVENSMQEEKDAEMMIAGIEAVLRSFFGSASVEQMLRSVRHPGRVAPLMGKHYGETAPVPVRVEKVMGMAPVTIENRAIFWIASCQLEGGKVVQVLVEAPKSTEAKVDWETYVGYQPMEWDEFARTRPGGYTGDFRVYVEPDNYYSHEFADSEAFSSFRLTAARGEETLNGYTPRGGELEQRLMEIIAENGGGSAPMILRLHLPEGLDSKRGVYVVDMACPRWVFVDNPEKGEP